MSFVRYTGINATIIATGWFIFDITWIRSKRSKYYVWYTRSIELLSSPLGLIFCLTLNFSTIIFLNFNHLLVILNFDIFLEHFHQRLFCQPLYFYPVTLSTKQLVLLFNHYMNNWYFIKLPTSIDFIYLFDLI